MINPYNILVVHNNYEVCLSIESHLKNEEYSVRTAHKKSEIQDALKEKEYALAIVDVEANDKEYFSFIRKSNQMLPIMAMISPDTPENDKAELVKHGLSAYIHKPISLQKLVNIIDRKKRLDDKATRQVLITDYHSSLTPGDKQEFEQCGLSIRTASDEASLFEKIMNNNFGVVVLDRKSFKDEIKSLPEQISSTYPYINIIVKDFGLFDSEVAYLKSKKAIFDYTATPISIAALSKKINAAFADREEKIARLGREGQGHLWAISGPRAAGKTVTVDGLVNALPCTYKVVRHTARLPRPNEINGEDHLFVNEEYFKGNNTDFLQIFRHKNKYTVGIERQMIEDQLSQGKDVLLTMANFNSFLDMKMKHAEMKSILINTHPETLIRRAKDRDGVAETLKEAREEYELFDSNEGLFDYVVWNRSDSLREGSVPFNPSLMQRTDLEKRIKMITGIIKSERFKLILP